MAKKVGKKKASKKKTQSKKKASRKSSTNPVEGALSELNGEWQDSEAIEGFGDVPEGKYQVVFEETEVGFSKASNRLQCVFTLKIASGQYAGQKLWKRDGMSSAENMGYLKGGLARLGIEVPDDITDLPEALAELVGTHAEVQVKVKGDFVNVYFQKAIDDDQLDGGEELDEDEEADPEENGEDEEAEIEVGSTVLHDDGEEYEVTKMKGDDLTIKNDDGDEYEVLLSEVALVESEEEEEAEDEETDGGDEEDEEEGVTVTFKKLTTAHKKKVKEYAADQEFEVNDYETELDLLADIAEYVGVTGEYKTPVALFKAMDAALKED